MLQFKKANNFINQKNTIRKQWLVNWVHQIKPGITTGGPRDFFLTLALREKNIQVKYIDYI